MAPQSKIVALLAAFVAFTSAAPIAGVTTLDGAKAPTLLYNHEGGVAGRDVNAVDGAKAPTLLYNHEGGVAGRDVSAVDGAKAPTLLYNHEGGVQG